MKSLRSFFTFIGRSLSSIAVALIALGCRARGRRPHQRRAVSGLSVQAKRRKPHAGGEQTQCSHFGLVHNSPLPAPSRVPSPSLPWQRTFLFEFSGGHGRVANSASFSRFGMTGSVRRKFASVNSRRDGVVEFNSQLHCQNQRRDNHGFPDKLKQLNVDIKTSKQKSAGKFREQGGWAFLGRTKPPENVMPAPARTANQNHENNFVFDDLWKTTNRRSAVRAPLSAPLNQLQF